MHTFTVKSSSAKEEIQKPHFSALNKGLNSGKPLLQPCPNCYKIETENGEFKEVLYWVSFTLCQAKAFHPYLIGSVIPFSPQNNKQSKSKACKYLFRTC